ncbi:MAG: hypothetical protein WCO03_02335, partial [bacterium]
MRIKNIFVSITPICVGVMLLLFGFGGGLVRAQETAASKTLPDVYIGGLKTDKTTYQAGETVKGSFIVHNESLNEATDLYYNVGLDGDYDPDGVSGLAYDYKRVGPIVVPGGGQNAIDFTYKLPGSISGDKLGIKIRVVTANDLSLAWRDSMIKVIGGSVGFRWEDSGIKLGGQTFGVQVGPTVYKDKKEVAQIFAVLGNGEKKAVSGRVELRVYNRVAVGEPLFKKDLGTVTVNPGKNLRVESDLPNFNYQPGVYVGEIVVLDPAGSQISALMPFRYLIGGALVNIQNVSLDT